MSPGTAWQSLNSVFLTQRLFAQNSQSTCKQVKQEKGLVWSHTPGVTQGTCRLCPKPSQPRRTNPCAKDTVGAPGSIHPAGGKAHAVPALQRGIPLTCRVFFKELPFIRQLGVRWLGRTCLPEQAKSQPGSWSASVGSRLRNHPDKR